MCAFCVYSDCLLALGLTEEPIGTQKSQLWNIKPFLGIFFLRNLLHAQIEDTKQPDVSLEWGGKLLLSFLNLIGFVHSLIKLSSECR